jgi:hypothetical protein
MRCPRTWRTATHWVSARRRNEDSAWLKRRALSWAAAALVGV